MEPPILFSKARSAKESFDLLRNMPTGYTFCIDDCSPIFVKVANKHFLCVTSEPVGSEFDDDHRPLCMFGLHSGGEVASVHKKLDHKAARISRYLYAKKHLTVSDHCKSVAGAEIAEALAKSGLLRSIYERYMPIGLNDTIGGTHYLALLNSDDPFIENFECVFAPLVFYEETYRIVKIPVSSGWNANWYPVVTIDDSMDRILVQPDNKIILSALV